MTGQATLPTPIGPLRLAWQGDALVAASFVDGAATVAQADLPAAIAAALDAYFRGENALHAIIVAPRGSAFELAVWQAVRAIPFGTTASYGSIARALSRVPGGDGGIARAVGQANARNPLALFIPCHRVVGGNGALSGYAWGVERKRWLLVHEGALQPDLWGE
jgi:methylated-DNA-[protein]-cysteine S-methyltransferase